MKSILFILLISVPAAAQAQSNLRQKYGTPLSESFVVRPDIIVTATYGKDGGVCEMVIKPRPPVAPIKSNEARLKTKSLDEIIDELIPMSERGKHIISGFLNLRCLPADDCAGTEEVYEKVYIYRNGGVDAHRYATIQWKKETCRQ